MRNWRHWTRLPRDTRDFKVRFPNTRRDWRRRFSLSPPTSLLRNELQDLKDELVTHLVEHDAERKEIGSRIDGLALRLLGRHVRDRTQDLSLAGDRHRRQPRGARGRRGDDLFELRQAEVEDLHAA